VPIVDQTDARYPTHFPPDSDLQGWVQSTQVYFRKTHQGTHYGGYQVGDNLVGFQTVAHVVHYGGRVSSNGEEIEGK
jgi:hypothetical protein